MLLSRKSIRWNHLFAFIECLIETFLLLVFRRVFIKSYNSRQILLTILVLLLNISVSFLLFIFEVFDLCSSISKTHNFFFFWLVTLVAQVVEKVCLLGTDGFRLDCSSKIYISTCFVGYFQLMFKLTNLLFHQFFIIQSHIKLVLHLNILIIKFLILSFKLCNSLT